MTVEEKYIRLVATIKGRKEGKEEFLKNIINPTSILGAETRAEIAELELLIKTTEA